MQSDDNPDPRYQPDGYARMEPRGYDLQPQEPFYAGGRSYGVQPQDDQGGGSSRYQPYEEMGPLGDRDRRLGNISAEPENRYESPQAQQLLERAREMKQRPFWNPYNRDGVENA